MVTHKETKHKDVISPKLLNSLIEQDIILQHKITDLLVSMKSLNEKVSKMVDLFTEAGEYIKKGKYEDPLLAKLDDLLEQNKNLAKGLLLLEKYIKEKEAEKTAPLSRPFNPQPQF